MSIIKGEDNKKWINAFVVIVSFLVGYIFIRFAVTMGEWFDLEAKINYFKAISQISGVVVGVITFLIIIKHKEAVTYLDEVYGELVKVVWPDKDSVVKLTVGIIIGITIVSGILVLIDYLFIQLLSLIY